MTSCDVMPSDDDSSPCDDIPGMAPPAGRIPLVMGGEPRRAGHPLNGGEPRRPRSRGMAAPFPSDGTPLPAARGHFPGGWQPLLRGTGAPLPRVGGDGFHEGRGPLARGRGAPSQRDSGPCPEGRGPFCLVTGAPFPRDGNPPLTRGGTPLPEGRVPLSRGAGAPFQRDGCPSADRREPPFPRNGGPFPRCRENLPRRTCDPSSMAGRPYPDGLEPLS